MKANPTGRLLFYSEPSRDGAYAGRPRGLARLYRGIRARWKRSQGGAAKAGRKAWDWLHARTHPDEPLYAQLRNARSIDLRHPTAMAPAEIEAAWSRFLTAGLWRHIPWLTANVLIAPLTLIIALLPGPNLVGYWFVYRAFHHLFILMGIARAWVGGIPTRLVPVAALDAPVGVPGDPAAEADHLAEIGLVKRPRKLAVFLARQGLGAVPAGSGSSAG